MCAAPPDESTYNELVQAVLAGALAGEDAIAKVPAVLAHVLLQVVTPSVQQEDDASPKDSVSSSPVGVVQEAVAPPGHGLPLTVVAAFTEIAKSNIRNIIDNFLITHLLSNFVFNNQWAGITVNG
jgi:hypothetical protein